MARGKKTPPEVIYKVMISWAETDSYAETARFLGVAESTVEKIVKDNKDKPEFVELCDQKRKDFVLNATKAINKGFKRLFKILDDDERDIAVNHLVMMIGTMTDKKAVAEGKSTNNVTINVKLPEGIEEYAG